MTGTVSSKGNLPSFPLGSSALAGEVRRLGPIQRSAMGVTDEAILLWDVIVSCAAVLIDDSDPRPWQERLAPLMDQIFGDGSAISPEQVKRAEEYFGQFTTADLPKWAKDLRRDGPVRFLVRMLGARAFRACFEALQTDGAVITIALRRATRAILPYAAALDDIYAVAPAKSATRLPGIAGTPSAVLLLAIGLDEIFGEKARTWGLPLALATSRGEQVDLSADDLPDLVGQFHEFTVNRSRETAAALNATLDRKIRGARDAIEHSADAVGQAATSLIELLDRILRSAFTDEYVLQWIERNYKSSAGALTYVPKDSPDGKLRPTKRGQALCFAHAGADTEKPSPLHELAAEAVAAARSSLQRLKHNDRGTPEELEELGQLLAAVEGFMTLVVGVMWNSASDELMGDFRARLDS